MNLKKRRLQLRLGLLEFVSLVPNAGADGGDACGLRAGMCQHGWLGRLALSEAGASHGACWLQRPLQELALWHSCPADGAPERSPVSKKSEVAGSTSML